MSKSNPVHLWRFGRTTALIFTQKWLNRAKTGVLHGTLKIFPRSNKSVSRVHRTQLTKINWKIKNISSGLVTRRLYFFQKSDTFWPKFPSWGIWPIYVYTSNSTSSVCALWQPVLWIPAPTTQSAIKATVSTPKTQLLVELLKAVGSLQISLENTLASAHPLSASSSWRANAGLVTCRDPARTESKWRKAATTKFCAERIPVLRSWASLSFLVPVTSATNFLGYSVGFYYPMPHDSSPRRRRLSLRRIKESQTQVHLNWVIQLYVFPVEQRIAPAKM